ncbi:MAG: rod shape-determining protein MreC [Candidatus Atribacteria bacterium]|nr:rod shape-determining protein MreC [Candidatus Atribacteria bacterium]
MDRNGNRKILILIVLVVISSQILIWAVRTESSRVENVRSYFLPIYRVGERVRDVFQGWGRFFSNSRILGEENQKLKEELDKLRAENILLQEKIEELKMKIEAGAMEEELPFEVIPAQVIGRDPYDWWGKAIIDQGKEEGITEGLVVVTYQGMVGKIEEVYPHHSVVRLLLSPSLSVGVLVQRTRDLGVVTGNGEGLCLVKYIYRTSDLKEGDIVITSGGGENIPRGIIVGEVLQIEKSGGGLFQNVTVEPSCDFSLLNKVFVIKALPQELK